MIDNFENTNQPYMDGGIDPSNKTAADLRQIYREAEDADRDLFSEMKSNVLLVNGEHYTKKSNRFFDRIRGSKGLSQEQKIRLTKNHIQRITKIYVNEIISSSPSTMILPQNDKELQDQKSAELHSSVWEDIKKEEKFLEKVSLWAHDFVEIGECATKVFYEPGKGKLLGYYQQTVQEVDPATGQYVERVLTDENGQPVQEPVFAGRVVFEKINPFNLLRAQQAESMDDSPFLIYRKMVKVKDLKKMFPDKSEYIHESSENTYTVFSSQHGNYSRTKGMCMVREYYYRPCADYPDGYFYIAIDETVLAEGQIPFGLFPIFWCGFDQIQSSPRARSIIKQLRPYQAEINRTASKIAEHQITLGDDKILYQHGAKISSGFSMPGVRSISYTGAVPTVMAGRNGGQYLDYLNSQITEMYRVANIDEVMAEKDGAVQDPFASLFKDLKQKKKFAIYADKFQRYIVSVTEAGLKVKKHYTNDQEIIPVIGKKEFVNIAEYKNSQDIGYQIKVEPISDDIHTQFGKTLMLREVMQYAGKQLEPEVLGQLIRQLPFLNAEKTFSDLTIDYDNATNDILALDRGMVPAISQYSNHKYLIRRVTNRMKQSDFLQLSPEIQKNYEDFVSTLETVEAEIQKQIRAANADLIPTSGPLVSVEFYVENDDGAVKRAKLPHDSIRWLIERLEQQGNSQNEMERLSARSQADIASMAAGTQNAIMPV